MSPPIERRPGTAARGGTSPARAGGHVLDAGLAAITQAIAAGAGQLLE